MDTIVVSPLLKVVAEKLGSALINKFSMLWGVKKNLETLESTISTIRELLDDAEQCCLKNKQDLNWLRELKEVVYDADDLLDTFNLETKKQKAESYGQTSRVIGNFVSNVNPIKRLKLGKKIKSINKRLDTISVKRTKFHLQITASGFREETYSKNPGTLSMVSKNPGKSLSMVSKNPDTLSIVNEDSICGRDNERVELMSQLKQSDGNKNISIISIVGLGGLGKTTLAQLVYNNENDLKGYFDPKIWVYVSQDFNVGRIMRASIESISKTKCELENLDPLAKQLETLLTGKRFLLVLDDIWNENQEDWDKLKVVFNCGASGSKIIATTRSMKVSQVMESTSNFVLNGLSEKMSWTLFKQMAFNGSESGLNSQIHEIAKEIVKKCGGVPLALKALGSAMKFKKNVKEWEEARDSDIWERDEGNEVMASLKLSYMNLSSQLKECFTYCSIFPKGHVINKQDLIGQWMANGLVSFTSTRGMEVDWGNEYFERLVQVSFLQNIVEQIDSAKVTCNMHDLVHDLAQSISDQRILLINDTGKAIHKDNGEVNPNKIKKMRALYIRSGDSDVINMVSEAQSLRSLFLESIVLYDTLFISISKLIHLRYICISDCLFTTIPNDISTLWSLEALHLRHFHMIKYFPESIGKLINLRTLELVTCMLTHLPKSIGHCQSLQNLIVSSTQITSIPNSLGQLVNLKSLNISYCYELVKIPEGAFGQFHSIRTLNLSHCMILKEVPFSIGKLVSLEILNMSMCEQLKWLPESIGNLHKLRFLNLHRCKSLEKVPESIGNLINIESLDLSWCENLKCLPKSIGNLDKLCFLNLHGCESLEKVPESIGDLINLESLDFSWCENLKCLQKSIGNLDKLCFLNLHGCENIQKVPESIGDLINLESLDLSCCKNLKYLPESIGNLDKLCFLNLDGCESLEKFPESIGNLINLEGLDFSWCKNLKYLPESIRNLDKLCFLNLDTCKSMETVTESIGHLINLESLDLSWCENLKCLPESIGNLDKLCFLNLHRCESLEKLPESIGNLINLESIDLSWCKNLKNLPESIGNLANLCVLNLDNFELNTIPKSIYNLRKLTSLNLDRFQNFYCMPAGISKLNGPDIQGLSIFSGVEDNKLACMSELKHLNIRGHLKICGLQNLNYPGEATQAKLKKKNLSSLKLTWCHNALNNCIECSLPVLEALQPPLSIKSLDLEGYPGKQYPNWMMVSNETRMTPFPNLTSLTLSQIKRCFNLPSLVGLPHLEYLTLEKMPYLTNYSGHFPSLVELYLCEMPNLEEVTTMNLDTNNIYNPAFPRLSKLVISGCPKVRIKPHLSPSVVELKLEKSNDELLGVEFFNGESSSEICSSSLGIRVLIISQMETQLVLLKQFSTITRLEFENYERNCLPESMRHLSSLRELKIYHCKDLHALPEWLGELKSLEELKIWCTPLTFLPQSMQHMNSLRQLWFWNCDGLHVLPEWFGELKSLIKLLIDETPLNCLPKSIKQLTTLQYLYIWNCPELERRYEHEKGEDWHLISHIPHVNIE